MGAANRKLVVKDGVLDDIQSSTNHESAVEERVDTSCLAV